MKKFLFTLVFFSLILPKIASADAYPHDYYTVDGSNISGVENTNVEMTSEKVVFSNFVYGDVKNDESDLIMDVKADFYMTNTGTEEEKMTVAFPFYIHNKYSDEEITDIKVLVEGKEIKHETEEENKGIKFKVDFEAQKTKLITISYKQRATRSYCGITQEFGYVLQTGARWKNNIGHGDIIVELPYEATKDNISLISYNNDINSTEAKRIDYKIEEGKLVYSFDDFNPTEDDDIKFLIIYPWVWERYLELEEEVKTDPSYDAYMELADIVAWYNIGNHSENIEKAFEHRYEKDIEWYYDKARVYSDDFHPYHGEGKCFSFTPYNQEKLKKLKKELINDTIIEEDNKEELIRKINYALFLELVVARDKYPEKEGFYTDEYIKNKMGDDFKYNDTLIAYINENKKKKYHVENEERFYKYLDGDYSFLGEEKDDEVTKFIKKYYEYISNQELDKAYEMSKKSVSLKTFKGWYSNTEQVNIEKILRITDEISFINLELIENGEIIKYGVSMSVRLNNNQPIMIENSNVDVLRKEKIISTEEDKKTEKNNKENIKNIKETNINECLDKDKCIDSYQKSTSSVRIRIILGFSLIIILFIVWFIKSKKK